MMLLASSRWLAGLALALAAAPAPGHGAFSVRRHLGYARPEATLAAFVAGEAGASLINTFCVVGCRQPGGDVAWGHWRQGHTLVLWEPSADPAQPRDLRAARRILDLRQDMVRSEAEIGASTYLVTRAWVRRVLSDCARAGDRFTIRARTGR